MHKVLFLIVLLIGAIGLFGAAKADNSDLRFCNRTSSDINVGMVYQSGMAILSNTYTSAGRYNIRARSCLVMMTGLAFRGYIVVMEKNFWGNWVAVTPSKDTVFSRDADVLEFGTERVCVKLQERFDRQSHKSEIFTCPAGWDKAPAFWAVFPVTGGDLDIDD